MPTPDARKLQAIADEIRQLRAEGQWTETEFRRLFKEGRAAANGMPGATEGILKAATDWAWVERLNDGRL